VVLISLSKQVITGFGHSTFITLQLLFVPTNVVLKRYLACRTFCKCQSNSNEKCLSKRTYTYKIDADIQLHNCVCGTHCLSRWQCCKLLAKSFPKRTMELQLVWLLCIAMWKWITRNQYRTFCAANNIVNCLILKRLFSKYDAWLIFCSDNMATISEASCRAYQYEKLLIKI